MTVWRLERQSSRTWKVIGEDTDGDGDVDSDDGGVDMNGDGDKTDTVCVDDTILVAGKAKVTDDQLTAWLSGFPESVTIVVILDSCYSGSFVPDLQEHHRQGRSSRCVRAPGGDHGAPADDVAYEKPITNGVLTQGILDALAIVPGSWWDWTDHDTSAADRAGNKDDITTTRELFAWAGPSSVTYIASDEDGDGAVWRGQRRAHLRLDGRRVTRRARCRHQHGSVPTTGSRPHQRG